MGGCLVRPVCRQAGHGAYPRPIALSGLAAHVCTLLLLLEGATMSASTEPASGKETGATSRIHHVDLRPYANRDYVDDVAGDGVGGWSDQGPANSVPSMPGGELRCGDISFNIIGPAHEKRIVALQKKHPALPHSLTIEPLDTAAAYIHIMHAVAYGAPGSRIATYSFETSEGTAFSQDIVQGEHIANYWFPLESESMKTVWFGANDECPLIGINAVTIPNPSPEQQLTRLRIHLHHPEAVLLLCAVTLADQPLTRPRDTGVVPVYNRYGGFRRVFFDDATSGFFTIRRRGDKWWFVDPMGHGFISKAVNSIGMRSSPNKDGISRYYEHAKKVYRDKTDWAEKNVARLKRLHFNTAGSWCAHEVYERLPHNRILNCAGAGGFKWVERDFFDVFSREFVEGVDEICRKRCAPHKDNPLLIGYFSDNELNWAMGADARSYMIDFYLGQDKDAAGRAVILDVLKGKHDTIAALNRAWGTEYTSFDALAPPQWDGTPPRGYLDDNDLVIRTAARQYFSVCNTAIKKHDPNHLYMGCRLAFPNKHMQPVYEGMQGHVDVVSVNHYREKPAITDLRQINEVTGAPVVITEFSFVAMDSGLPNTKGASNPVGTQAERAWLFDNYVSELMRTDFVIGYHWFQYIDQPHEGRGLDGENQNYGILKHNDEIYEVLAETMRVVNGSAERLRM
ncbi:MAG: hypothetical protein GF331_15685 [Chitinivibrionales bacterium]|nr:hypothetical protein [Chitinivibrionales bacterium]